MVICCLLWRSLKIVRKLEQPVFSERKEKVTEEAEVSRHITMFQVNAVHGSCANDMLM